LTIIAEAGRSRVTNTKGKGKIHYVISPACMEYGDKRMTSGLSGLVGFFPLLVSRYLGGRGSL